MKSESWAILAVLVMLGALIFGGSEQTPAQVILIAAVYYLSAINEKLKNL